MNLRPSQSRTGYDSFSARHAAHFTASTPGNDFFDVRKKKPLALRMAFSFFLLALALLAVNFSVNQFVHVARVTVPVTGLPEEFDGYTLEIRYVDNLTIVAKDPSRVQIETSPRYADVLRFQSCTGITLDGFTAGHIDGLGSCTGNVLGFYRTDEITVKNCSLFGCGVIGIDASLCTGMTVMGTEIHHCESSAASLWNCQDVSFTDCNIHDNGDDHIHTNECANVSIDRKSLIK